MMSIADARTRYPQRFRIVCSAGEPLNPEAIRWFRDQYDVTVLDFYGLTESYPLCGNFPFMEVREGSMGRPPPGWQVAILDEDERPVAPGERGEICLRARTNPHYPLGYWRLPEESERTFGGDWFHTKDAASMDQDGYVWYEGRADDVIISAGYRIGPFEVESACIEHHAVAEAAAVAAPDQRRGHVVKAFIVLAADHEASDALAGDQGVRSRSALRLCLSAAHRVRRRAAEDAHRQDQADRVTRKSVGTVSRTTRRPLVVERSGQSRCDPGFRSSSQAGTRPAATPATARPRQAGAAALPFRALQGLGSAGVNYRGGRKGGAHGPQLRDGLRTTCILRRQARESSSLRHASSGTCLDERSQLGIPTLASPSVLSRPASTPDLGRRGHRVPGAAGSLRRTAVAAKRLLDPAVAAALAQLRTQPLDRLWHTVDGHIGLGRAHERV